MKIAKKWRRIASIRRKNISSPSFRSNKNSDFCSTSSSSSSSSDGKGNFVIYTNDHKRFIIPIEYLNSNIIKELLKMSEEVFGLTSEGPIKLPCDAVFMEYVVTLIRRGLAKDIEKALLMSMETSSCSLSVGYHQEYTSQQLLICGY
ncbi:auxin-responsive protein SAUR67 [Jatropha curcas]|nr:auxin-responsive protein SAUR67 [Jatropha curcas]